MKLAPKLLVGLVAGASVIGAPAHGQTFSLGADIVSRYVWRGIDFGESMSVQPSLTISSAGGFSLGAWASYSISASGAGANESDLSMSYAVGAFTFGVNDYYFPGPQPGYGEEGEEPNWGFFNTRAHTWEPFVSYSGQVELLAGLANSFVDEGESRENALYVELGIPFEVEGVDVSLHGGVVGGESSFYGTSGAALVNVGITGSKAIEITDTFEVPASVAYIVNPSTQRSFLVFGISLAP